MQRLFSLLTPEEIDSILPVLQENLRDPSILEDANQWSWLFPYFRSNAAPGWLVFYEQTSDEK